jgi:hypothetical protein
MLSIIIVWKKSSSRTIGEAFSKAVEPYIEKYKGEYAKYLIELTLMKPITEEESDAYFNTCCKLIQIVSTNFIK